MSAWLVSNTHIDVLVHYAGECGPDATRAGRMLLRENMRSLQSRYGGAIDEDKIAAYTFTKPKRDYSPVEVLKACDCYDYQACESADYRMSDASRFIYGLRKDIVRSMPGYDAAPWGIEAEKVVTRAPRTFMVALRGVPRGKGTTDPCISVGMVEAPDRDACEKRVRELFERVTDLVIEEEPKPKPDRHAN